MRLISSTLSTLLMSTKALYVHNPMPPLPGQVTLNNFEIGSGCGGKVIYNE